MPPETDNLKLEELYQADQSDRGKVYETAEAVQGLKDRDAARRKRIYVMMELSEVRTLNDLYYASVVLHHGDEPADFLTGHRMASVAAMMGHRTARWVAAASLDRYLMSVGLPQVYGTQFEYNPESKRYDLKLPIQEDRKSVV